MEKMEVNVNKRCRLYIDMLMATGFHRNTRKEIFFDDFRNINKECVLDTSDMKNIHTFLTKIYSKHKR